MEFNKSYNRQEFVGFLQNRFLPEDFEPCEEEVFFTTKTKYSTEAVKLGTCESLDLVVYEVKHNSKHDARVSLSKEAFRILADELEDRALVVFVPEDSCDNYRFSFIEITLSIEEGLSRVTRKYSNPHRYSYYLGKGIAYHTPNKYLNEKGRVVDDEDLHSRFSVEVLTKEFYQELSDWYELARLIIRFPNKIDDPNDDDKFNNEGAIRLITRLIFVWFLKQRHLVPDEFFDEKYISEKLLKDFNPKRIGGLFNNYESTETQYYKAILQNLFFAMLNSPITPEGSNEISERRFRKQNSDYNNKKLMRYEVLFKNPELFVQLANKTVPYLNGGLFDCLDKSSIGIYYDGFSDRKEISDSLKVPDLLFFGEEGISVNLLDWNGDDKNVVVRGIIDILKRYNFTVEENTPFDKEVSLDPELLGKVFENLLASYNPDTQKTARKLTGSFYTPRDVVQYMVDESLIEHLKRKVGDNLESQFRKLLQYTDEDVELTDGQRKEIMQSLYDCKILDPACGSGAFPMGMLQQMVHILNRVDKDNSMWKEMIKKEAGAETSDVYINASDEERKELLADIDRSFDEKINRPDYSRKLYIIENCIYGVDIQPIAIQISKLRFFISLVVDQNTNNDPTDNFGIRPLPNLEAKFVAANTLVGVDKINPSLFDTPEVLSIKEELKKANHKIFSAKTNRTKERYRNRLIELRKDLADKLYEIGALGFDESQKIVTWDMFDQNNHAYFFDLDWMFGIKDGFDIVIGNPPYGVSIKDNYRKQVVHHLGKVPDFEIYYYFIEIAKKLIGDNGILSYIIPNTWLFNTYAKNYRLNLFNQWNMIEILDCTKFPIFENAVVRNSIITWQKIQDETSVKIGYRNTKNANTFNELVNRERMSMSIDSLIQLIQNWGLAFYLDKKTLCIVSKIKTKGNELSSLFPNISQGLIAYDKYKGQSEYIIKNRVYHYFEYHEGLKKWLWGEDVKRYSVKWNQKEFIDYCDGIANPRQPEFFNGTRLLIREITNPSIFAALANEELYNDPAIIIVKDSTSYSIKVALAILNSKLATFYHFNHSPKATKGAFPKIIVQDIKDFPLAKVTDEEKKNIHILVDKILQCKDEVDYSYSSLNNMIDEIVYHLYGLTYDEVLIVDPKTPISREEYEK